MVRWTVGHELPMQLHIVPDISRDQYPPFSCRKGKVLGIRLCAHSRIKGGQHVEPRSFERSDQPPVLAVIIEVQADYPLATPPLPAAPCR